MRAGPRYHLTEDRILYLCDGSFGLAQTSAKIRNVSGLDESEAKSQQQRDGDEKIPGVPCGFAEVADGWEHRFTIPR